MIQRPTGTLAAFGVSGSVMLCQDFDLRVCVDPEVHGYFGSVWCEWFCHVVSDFDLRVCVDPKAHGYFGSVWCEWFCYVVPGF